MAVISASAGCCSGAASMYCFYSITSDIPIDALCPACRELATFQRTHQWRAEAVGCPGPTRFLDALEFLSNKFLKEIFSIRLAKFLTTIFLVVHQNLFPIRLLKFRTTCLLVIYPNFSLFHISFQISGKFAPWMPPCAASCPSNDIFLFLL